MAMQNARDRVTRAIEFRFPDRLPVKFESLGHSDIFPFGWNQIFTGDLTKRRTYDEWGCGWTRTEVKNMGQITEHPLADWKDMDGYTWPDPDNEQFYEGMEKKIEDRGDRYVLTSLTMLLFERMHSLRGFQNVLMDLYLEKQRVEELADRIVDFDLGVIRNIAARFGGQVQGISFSDDWGTELSTIVNGDLWREFFKPRYRKIFDECKRSGWHVWMHSCGKINEIIGDWIDVGLDVINLQQPRALGIEEIGARFAGKICFFGPCDIQRTLPFGSDAQIEEEARLLLDRWGTARGGYILGDYGDGDAIGVSVERKRTMYEAFMRNDRWKKGD